VCCDHRHWFMQLPSVDQSFVAHLITFCTHYASMQLKLNSRVAKTCWLFCPPVITMVNMKLKGAQKKRRGGA